MAESPPMEDIFWGVKHLSGSLVAPVCSSFCPIVSKEKALPILWKNERWWWYGWGWYRTTSPSSSSGDVTWTLPASDPVSLHSGRAVRRPPQRPHPSTFLKVAFFNSFNSSLSNLSIIHNIIAKTCPQCCRSVQDNSGTPGQCPNKVADRENHLELLSPPADASGG